MQELQAETAKASEENSKLNLDFIKLTKEYSFQTDNLESLKVKELELLAELDALKEKFENEAVHNEKSSNSIRNENARLRSIVDNLTEELSTRAVIMPLSLADRNDDSDSLFAKNDELSDKFATPNNSPPRSPIKGTPAHHAGLENETMKASLSHAHRTITNLRGSIHREKTEKMEMRRIISELQEELDSLKNNGKSNSKRARNGQAFGQVSQKRSTLLGGGRRSQVRVSTDLEESEEEEADVDWETFNGYSETFISALESAEQTSTENEGFETANDQPTSDDEISGLTTENETDAYKTGVESIGGQSEGENTETEFSPRPEGSRTHRRLSFNRSMETDDDEEIMGASVLRSRVVETTLRIKRDSSSFGPANPLSDELNTGSFGSLNNTPTKPVSPKTFTKATRDVGTMTDPHVDASSAVISADVNVPKATAAEVSRNNRERDLVISQPMVDQYEKNRFNSSSDITDLTKISDNLSTWQQESVSCVAAELLTVVVTDVAIRTDSSIGDKELSPSAIEIDVSRVGAEEFSKDDIVADAMEVGQATAMNFTSFVSLTTRSPLSQFTPTMAPGIEVTASNGVYDIEQSAHLLPVVSLASKDMTLSEDSTADSTTTQGYNATPDTTLISAINTKHLHHSEASVALKDLSDFNDQREFDETFDFSPSSETSSDILGPLSTKSRNQFGQNELSVTDSNVDENEEYPSISTFVQSQEECSRDTISMDHSSLPSSTAQSRPTTREEARRRLQKSSQASLKTNPPMIQAVVQTMMGDFLYKYTRKLGRQTISGRRHKRFFWVQPYTRTLCWGDKDPHSSTEVKVKSGRYISAAFEWVC